MCNALEKNALLEQGLKCNILLIGKSGSGKSSFANYLFGIDTFTTGTGKPVTGWAENFQHYAVHQHDIAINIFDSVGLEADNYSKWMHALDTFLASRQVEQWEGITHATELLHHVYYVVNGAGARLLEQELQIIRTLALRYSLNISLIITNCDVAAEDQIAALEAIALSQQIESIRVCSISRKTRAGDKTEPFGRDAAIRKLLESSYEYVGTQLSIATVEHLIKKLKEMRHAILRRIDKEDISIFKMLTDDNSDEWMDSISEALDEMTEELQDLKALLPPEYDNYHDFIESFNVEFRGKDIFEETFDSLGRLDG